MENTPAEVPPSTDDTAVSSRLSEPVESQPTPLQPQHPSIKDDAFEQLKRDFDETIQTLGASSNLAKFKTEYEHLFASMCQARENEIRLLDKLQQVHNEVNSSNSKISGTAKVSQADRITIANLKKEVKKAWQAVEEANDKEIKSIETLSHLRLEVSDLQQNLSQTSTASIAQEQAVSELIRVLNLEDFD